MTTKTQPATAWQLERERAAQSHDESAKIWRMAAIQAVQESDWRAAGECQMMALQNENAAKLYRNNPKKENV